MIDDDEEDSFFALGIYLGIQLTLIFCKIFKTLSMDWWKIYIPTYIAIGVLILSVIAFKILSVIQDNNENH